MRDYAEKSGHVPSNWRHVLQLNLSVQVFRILEPESHQIRLETVWLSFTIDVLRYKCVTCQNYDLCRHCEALQLHPAHDMVPQVFSCPVQLNK